MNMIMTTFEEVINQKDEFAKIVIYNMATNILDKFIEENNGVTRVNKGVVIHWCEYKENLITFTYPEGHQEVDLETFGQYNKFSLRVNTVQSSLRLFDIATTFGKYTEDINEQYKKFIEIMDLKIKIAGF